jgi:hypothetical protein
MSKRDKDRALRVTFANKPAPGGLCWICDRRLYAGGRSYVLVTIDGVERPVHGDCARKAGA